MNRRTFLGAVRNGACASALGVLGGPAPLARALADQAVRDTEFFVFIHAAGGWDGRGGAGYGNFFTASFYGFYEVPCVPAMFLTNLHAAKEWFKVLQTTDRSQTAVMNLAPGEASGEEPEAH